MDIPQEISLLLKMTHTQALTNVVDNNPKLFAAYINRDPVSAAKETITLLDTFAERYFLMVTENKRICIIDGDDYYNAVYDFILEYLEKEVKRRQDNNQQEVNHEG